MADEPSNQLLDDLWSLLRGVRRVKAYTKGTTLFCAKEPAQGVYLVEQGAVRIYLPSSDPKRRFEQTAGPGVLLGLSEAVTGEDHKFSAEASEDSQTWFVERQDLLRLLRQNQFLCLQILRLLSEDLHLLYHKIQANSRPVPPQRKARI